MIKKPNRHTKIVETNHFNEPLSIPNPRDITEINYLTETDRNSIFKGANFTKTVTFLSTTLSPSPLCLPPLLILPFSVPYQKRSQRHSPTITPFNIP